MTESQRHTPELGYAPADSRAEDRAMRAGERSPEQIEREIEATRDRMSQNIDALGERLSPARIKERAKEKVRYTGNRVGNVVRDNAVPIGLVGAGVTWMMLKRGDHSGAPDLGPLHQRAPVQREQGHRIGRERGQQRRRLGK
jgi:hypothetical protein